jgi:hypothetical protein
MARHMAGARALGPQKRGNCGGGDELSLAWSLRLFLALIPAARHGLRFGSSLRTGTFCAYRPETPVAWTFSMAAQPVPA